MALLTVNDLSIGIQTSRGLLHAVKNISFEVAAGETLGLVGESGCGKSLTSLALLDLLPSNSKLKATSILFEGSELLQMSPGTRRSLSGPGMAMIFQDPMASLNPCLTIGYQLAEAVRRDGKTNSKADIRNRSIDLLKRVRIPDPEKRLVAYPHELSGGMSQRVMIAMAISCNPRLLIADEPTTALDVTIQAQILALLLEIQRDMGMSMILISHDMGVVSQMSDHIAVMYAGEIVEMAETEVLLRSPRHPYTASLIKCLPARQTTRKGKLETISGSVPNLINRLSGCSFQPRCSQAVGVCVQIDPEWEVSKIAPHQFKCHHPMMAMEGIQ